MEYRSNFTNSLIEKSASPSITFPSSSVSLEAMEMDAPISVELIHGEVRTHTHPYSSMKSSKMPFPPPLKVDSRNVNFRSRSANSGGGESETTKSTT